MVLCFHLQPSEALPTPATPRITVRSTAYTHQENAFGLRLSLRNQDLQANPVSDVLHTAPGVRIRQGGGIGQPIHLSIRGSQGHQNAVFIDGIPLHSGMLEAPDLSLLNTAAVDTLDVYRSHPPLPLAKHALGGAVNMRTARHHSHSQDRASLTLGSLSRFSGKAKESTHTPWGPLSLAFVTHVAQNDFYYFDNARTPLETEDDTFSKRQNNDAFILGAMASLSTTPDATHHLLFQSLDRGIPGAAGAPSQAARNRQNEARWLHHRRRRQPHRLTDQRMALAWLERHWSDPEAEIGLGAEALKQRYFDLYYSFERRHSTSKYWTHQWQTQLQAGALQNSDTLISTSEQFSRSELNIGYEATWIKAPWALSAGQQFFGSGWYSSLRSPRYFWGWEPRIGVGYRLTPHLQIKSNAGRYVRLPSTAELYGNGVFILGNDVLEPEQGLNTELGFEFSGATIQAQLIGFYRNADSLIQWLQVGPVVRPFNLGRTEIYGIEAQCSARWHAFEIELNHNEARSFDRSLGNTRNQTLPFRPLRESRGLLRFHHLFSNNQSLDVEAEVQHRGLTYTDTLQRQGIPNRTTLHTQSRFELDLGHRLRFGVSLRVDNILNLRTLRWTPPTLDRRAITLPHSDFLGYPLPGRTFYVGLSVRPQK